MTMPQLERYPTLIGELQHLLNGSKSEIGKAVLALGSFSKWSIKQQWDESRRLLSSVSRTCTIGITYGTSSEAFEDLTDSNFAIMPGARSTFGLFLHILRPSLPCSQSCSQSLLAAIVRLSIKLLMLVSGIWCGFERWCVTLIGPSLACFYAMR